MGRNDSTPDQLLAAIRAEASDPSLTWARQPQVLTGGFWAQLWRVRLADDGNDDSNRDRDLGGELVARVMPNPEVAARETAVQGHLAAAGYPTPQVRLAAGPGPDLDRAWMLMDLAPGEPLLANLSGPSALLQLPRLARTLPQRLAQHAAALHRVDPDALPVIEPGTERVLGRLHDQATRIDRGDLVAIAEWLETNRPELERSVICHGDLHPFNILTDPTGDTVLDWSSAELTDPGYDIAYTRLLLGNPPLVAPRVLAPIVAAAGRWLAQRFISAYNETAERPIEPERLSWFTNLHTLRVLTDVATWHAEGELDQHRGHPYLAIAKPLTAQLSQNTGIAARLP